MGVLEKLFEKHQQWIEIVQTFGCNRSTAEDIVQESYIRIDKMIKKGVNIMYNETEVNYYYMFRTMYNLFIDLKRKEQKYDIIPYEDYSGSVAMGEEDEPYDIKQIYAVVKDQLNDLHWYDKKVYEIIEGGESISSLSEKTKISYYSLRNTYKKVEKKIKAYVKNL